jgi:hypothetical protein
MNILRETSNLLTTEISCANKLCYFGCLKKFTTSEIVKIENDIKSLSANDKHLYILKNVSKQTINNSNTKKFKFSYKIEGNEVCRPFFLKCFGYKSDKSIKYVLKNNCELVNSKVLISPTLNNKNCNKGNFKKKSSEFDNAIVSFIMSFNPQKSHYALSKCPNRLYINEKHNMTPCKLYHKFIKENNLNESCGYTYFKKHLKKLNIGFSRPSQDKCIKCVLYEIHNNIDLCDCKICLSYELHKKIPLFRAI